MRAFGIFLLVLSGCADVWGFEDGKLDSTEAPDASSVSSSANSVSSSSSDSSTGTGGSSSSSAGSGGHCNPTTTCAYEGLSCGSIYDGCNWISCGPYKHEPDCDADTVTFPYCACPESHFYSYYCNPVEANNPPPNGGCITNIKMNDAGVNNFGWCCMEPLP